MKCRAAAAIAFLVGCSGSHTSDRNEEVVLRVSATAGLSKLVPGLGISGSSAAASDLVFAEPTRYIESIRAEGARLILTRKASSTLSADELARLLRGQEIESARAVDATVVEAVASDEKVASLVAQYQAIGFDVGPFQVDEESDERIRLVRRGDGAIDVIELVASSRSDEWRKLLAHELDVVPLAASIYRAEFSGVESIRVLDAPANDTTALYFNVRSPQLADPDVRRRIAGAINREAVARVACGDAKCASPAIIATSQAEVPHGLTVLVPADFTTFLTAAKILRHQLYRIGIELTIESAPVNDIVQRMTTGQSQLALLPLTTAEHGFGFFLSPEHPSSLPMTGFASPDFDAAVDRGDLKAAQAILDRDVPVTRLFELRSFAAVDASFCGDVAPSAGSWLWLSKLYPCEEGPSP